MRTSTIVILLLLAAGALCATDTPTMDEAQSLARQGLWDQAQTAFAAIVAAEPDNGAAWFMLGYSHYSRQQWDETLAAWEHNVALDYRTADTLYSMACVLSLAGRVDPALDAFARALEAGFDDPYLIADDSDLDPIREHPRFKELFTPPPPHEPHPEAIPVAMTTPSGTTVFAELYRAKSATPAAPVVILVHQAGSNGAEYQPIAPRLAAAGYHALAVDARGGGRRFGRDNRTVAAIGPSAGYSPAAYDNAVEDTLTAVGWLRARAYGGPLFVWGSSYSAANVLRLLAEAPAVFSGGLAFSGGDPSDDAGEPYAPRVERPLLMTWPEHELGESQEADFAAVASTDKVLVRQTGGRHGSSTLFPDLNPGAEEIWTAVLAFLDRHSG